MQKMLKVIFAITISSPIFWGSSAYAIDKISYAITSPDLTQSTLSPNGKLDFSFSVSTVDPNPQPVYCYIDGVINPFEAKLVSGTTGNGNYSCQAAIPSKPMELIYKNGRYPVSVLIVYFDGFGKKEVRKTFGYVNFSTVNSSNSTSRTIICIKGNIEKSITGKKPVCPAGYVLKN